MKTIEISPAEMDQRIARYADLKPLQNQQGDKFPREALDVVYARTTAYSHRTACIALPSRPPGAGAKHPIRPRIEPAQQRAAMTCMDALMPRAQGCARAATWAQRLKRVFNIDIDKSAGKPICTVADCREADGHRDVPDETCEACGGRVKVIACLQDPAVIRRILDHLECAATTIGNHKMHPLRAPPQLAQPGLNDCATKPFQARMPSLASDSRGHVRLQSRCAATSPPATVSCPLNAWFSHRSSISQPRFQQNHPMLQSRILLKQALSVLYSGQFLRRGEGTRRRASGVTYLGQ